MRCPRGSNRHVPKTVTHVRFSPETKGVTDRIKDPYSTYDQIIYSLALIAEKRNAKIELERVTRGLGANIMSKINVRSRNKTPEPRFRHRSL